MCFLTKQSHIRITFDILVTLTHIQMGDQKLFFFFIPVAVYSALFTFHRVSNMPRAKQFLTFTNQIVSY